MIINKETSTRIKCGGENFVVKLSPIKVCAYEALAYTMRQEQFGKVPAIKIIREAFGCGLREAKIFVEEAREYTLNRNTEFFDYDSQY